MQDFLCSLIVQLNFAPSIFCNQCTMHTFLLTVYKCKHTYNVGLINAFNLVFTRLEKDYKDKKILHFFFFAGTVAKEVFH